MSESTQAPDPNQSTTQDSPPSNEPAWYLDDSTPGQGARPDWLPTKFKKASDVGKSYAELEKRLGGFTGAPDAYDLTELEIDTEQHLVREITNVAKELNMSQDGLKKFLGRIASAQEAENQAHLDEQIKKLGKDGERMLVEYKNWTKDYLKPEERELVNEWVKSADDLQVFNRMMANSHASRVPTQAPSGIQSVETIKELRQEMAKNIERYEKDATYRADLSSRLSKAVAREGA